MLYANSGKLAVHAVGTKGLEEFKGSFKEDAIQWGCIKVLGVDQQQNVTSKRPKYVQISYVGKVRACFFPIFFPLLCVSTACSTCFSHLDDKFLISCENSSHTPAH
jgi:hypothetical protein